MGDSRRLINSKWLLGSPQLLTVSVDSVCGATPDPCHDAFVEKSLVVDKGTLYRVLIGRLDNRQEAAKMTSRIRARENVAPVIHSE